MQEIRLKETTEQEIYGILFREKLQAEWLGFLRRMLKRSKEDLINDAYRISTYRNIYQSMTEQSHFMDGTQLKALIVFPGLLGYLFGRWLKQEDSGEEELELCLKTAVMELEQAHTGHWEKGGAA